MKFSLVTFSEDNDDPKAFSRKKTPLPRGGRKVKEPTEEDLDENGIIDRDEDIYDDNDDVSTSTLRGSEESLEEYINEENKSNQETKTNGLNEKMTKFKKFMNNVKDKGKGLSCKTADTVIDEYQPADIENNTNNTHKKSCLIM